ncbi:fumarylacetoacetate hydrolase family protein [Amphritea pacifica]|uniref:Fumarylacetoacetate hydrolase family protein n=1 Tax=Amphritea pacifica TaxID=2811233 RepID=A0ABS2W9C1_9GAMM|nr:fumarylacetoacetate hydrolase family protein [Amphritea pacifica]MBN0988300.1 fumarylacetoacetate hydrolase family protein [Amphritea pacifica]MBN1005589.1 fumarylacetoacetate hydrolase family protein [Amphritea pacifica]
MKFATLKNDQRDGELALVSRDLSQALDIHHIVPGLQLLLENWESYSPALEQLYQQLNTRSIDSAFPFNSAAAMAPLPRSYQWLDGSAFLNHGHLIQQAFKLPPQDDERIPLMYQGASDTFIGANDPIQLPSEDHDIDFEGEFVVFLDDVPMACPADQALEHVRLISIVNDVSLRSFIQREIRSGFGFIQAKPSSSFAPVAVTPDELDGNWRDGRVCLPLSVTWNGTLFGHPDGGEMDFSFAELIAHAAYTRNLGAGTIIGSGTVSNKDSRRGSSCIAERRALEMIETGSMTTAFMQFGDQIRMEVFNADNETVFGAIDQRVSQGVVYE